MSEVDRESLKQKLVHMLDTMFDYLGLDGSFKVEDVEDRFVVKITTQEAGRVIGRKGQTLDCLQLLVNHMMFKGDESVPHISLDIVDENPRPRKSSDAPRGRGERRQRGDRGERGERGGRGESSGRSHFSVEQLKQQALDAAKEVKKWGDPVKMPEMNGHDRRIIHITLKDDAEIVTESEGEGAMKKVVVSLKKSEN